MLSCARCSWHKFTLTLNFYPHHFFSATSIKSQVCEVVRVIRTSLYQIHALFYCDEEGGEKEFKGYLFYIYNIYNIGIHTKWQLDHEHKFSISKKQQQSVAKLTFTYRKKASGLIVLVETPKDWRPKPMILQGSKLTFLFRSQLASNGKNLVPDRTFRSPNCFIADFIFYIACSKSHNLRAKTIRNSKSKVYRATVVLRWFVFGVRFSKVLGENCSGLESGL